MPKLTGPEYEKYINHIESISWEDIEFTLKHAVDYEIKDMLAIINLAADNLAVLAVIKDK